MKNVAQINENGQVIRFIDACEPSQVWSIINMEVKENAMMGEPAPRFAVMDCEYTPGKYMRAGGYSYQRKVIGVAAEFDLSIFPGSYSRADETIRSAFDSMLEGVDACILSFVGKNQEHRAMCQDCQESWGAGR